MDTTEHLTTGWEPDLPAADSLLRRFVLCWAALNETFATAAGGGRVERTAAYSLADLGRPAGFFNATTLLAPIEEVGGAAVLDDIEAGLAGGRGEAHLWSAWPTPDLRPRGWRLEGHPPLLIRPPAALVPPPDRSGGAPSLVAVRDEHQLAEWERVAAEGYPLPELLPVERASLAPPALLADPRLRFSLGLEDDRPVSLGTLFVEHGIACFALGVTLPGARGRGHWWAHAVDRLRAAPGLWAAGVFSDDSRPPAERLGFVPVLRLTLWRRSRTA